MQDNRIIPIRKVNETILVKLDGSLCDEFWQKVFPTWEDETFQIFDQYLDENKQFLDIGAWIGTTCIYASRKSSFTVAVEADPISIEKLRSNIKLNYIGTEICVEPKAIYSEITKIIFGPNSWSTTSCFNDSTSQVKIQKTKADDILVETTTIQEIISKYNLNNLSLIKVDIEGGEEFILEQVYHYACEHRVPLYIRFHYLWWNDKNLYRFSFLSGENIRQIQMYPFSSILFTF